MTLLEFYNKIKELNIPLDSEVVYFDVNDIQMIIYSALRKI